MTHPTQTPAIPPYIPPMGMVDGEEPTAEALAAWVAHLEAHFAREEALMTAAGYKDMPHHAAEHARTVGDDTFSGLSHTAIADFVYKWAPEGNPAERNLKIQGEYFLRRETGTFNTLGYAGNPDMVSRTHFARFLVEHGHCRDISEVFDRYLGDGKPGYVPHRWARLADAISWIKGAGGVAVMAHPGRYTLSLVEHSALFDEFKDLGGEGVEVITGSHTPDQYALYADVARRYGLLASRGSDFHGPGEGRIELGELPPLPDNLTPVWSRWMS